MKKNFFDAMGEIGDDLLSEASGTKKSASVNWRKALVVAACFALVASLGVGSALMLSDAPETKPNETEYSSTVDTSPKKPIKIQTVLWSDLFGSKSDDEDANVPVDGDTQPDDIALPDELPEFTREEDGIAPSPVGTGNCVDAETFPTIDTEIAPAPDAGFVWYVPVEDGMYEAFKITGVPKGTTFEEILTKYLDYCGYVLDVEYSAERVGERTETDGELVTHYPGVGVANVILGGQSEPDELMYKCLVNTVISSTRNSYVNIDYNGKNINIGGIAAPEGNAYFQLPEHILQRVETTADVVTGIDTLIPVPDVDTVPDGTDAPFFDVTSIPNIGYDTDAPVTEVSPDAMECYYFIPQDGGFTPKTCVYVNKMDGIYFVADFLYFANIKSVKPVSVTFGQLTSGEINARVRLWMREGVELNDLELMCLVNSLIKTYGCDSVSVYDYTGKTEKELLINGESAPDGYGAFDIENTDRTQVPDTTAASPYIPTPETTPSWGYEETTSPHTEIAYETTPVFPADTVEDLLPPASEMTLYVPTEDGGVSVDSVWENVPYSSGEMLEIYIEKLSQAKVKVVYFAMGLDEAGALQAKLDLNGGGNFSDLELKCIVNTVIDSFSVQNVKLFADGEYCYIDGVTFNDSKGFEKFDIQ